MATFGENLRREREMRGVSLEEIADATKISVRALQALEADQFEKLPGGIFTRSFIRTYAKYLGLDVESVMAEFHLVAPASAQQADLSRISQQRPPRAQQGSRAGLIGLLLALLVLAGGFAYYRFTRRVPRSQPSEAQPAPKPPAATSAAPSPGQPAGTTAPAVIATASTSGALGTSSSPTPSTSAPTGLVLQVAATERSWVAVESDGKPASQRIMEPNEIQTFRASTSFDLITGNAEGIILTLNGRTLDPLGHHGELKKVHLTLDDAQNVNP
jgi:cytoskeleton protein RodZ